VTVTDALDKADDAIAIELWDGNELLFASRWSGGQAVEQKLRSGSLEVVF
jgi:hypothetical protein